MNLDFLWRPEGISFTPKIHSMLCHAFQQMKRLGGFGDLLEDDLEHLHQISNAISNCTSCIKNNQQKWPLDSISKSDMAKIETQTGWIHW